MIAPAILAALSLAAPSPGMPCGTPTLMRRQPPPARPLIEQPLRKSGAKLAKPERDAFGTLPNSALSANFALKWGSAVTLSNSDAQLILASFEEAWRVEVDLMGHPSPIGSDTYRFNIYIADSGDGAPGGIGAGAYFYYDSAGWPMIVVEQPTVEELQFGSGAKMAHAAPHEFYHAIQDVTRRFGYDGVAAWFTEASAESIVGDGFPDDPLRESFVFAYAFYPMLPLHFFDYFDTGALIEYRQYGASIFLTFLSEQVADWTVVRDAWLDRGSEPDPLVVIDALLASWGVSLDTAFAQFAATNATWDYTAQAHYRDGIQLWRDLYPSEYHHIAATIGSAGTQGWQTPPPATLPQRYGYNLIEIASPPAGELYVGLLADPAGSAGSAAAFDLTLVRDFGGAVEYVPVPTADSFAEINVSGIGGEQAIYLAVAARSPRYIENETFGYQYMVAMAPPRVAAEEPAAAAGCDCAARPQLAPVWLLLLALASAARKRRPLEAPPQP